MMMMVTPPVAMTPTTAMNLNNICRRGFVDRCALAGKRTCSLWDGERKRGSDADSSESFIHRQSFLLFPRC